MIYPIEKLSRKTPTFASSENYIVQALGHTKGTRERRIAKTFGKWANDNGYSSSDAKDPDLKAGYEKLRHLSGEGGILRHYSAL